MGSSTIICYATYINGVIGLVIFGTVDQEKTALSSIKNVCWSYTATCQMSTPLEYRNWHKSIRQPDVAYIWTCNPDHRKNTKLPII